MPLQTLRLERGITIAPKAWRSELIGAIYILSYFEGFPQYSRNQQICIVLYAKTWRRVNAKLFQKTSILGSTQ